jgi:hypothetical protein
MAEENQFVYENQENNEEQDRRELVSEATAKIAKFLKRREPLLQKKIATRRAANLNRRLALKRRGNAQFNAGRATLQYNRRLGNIVMPPLFIANNEDPQVAELMISSHQNEVDRLKRKIATNYAEASLGNLRHNTNLSYADFKRQIATIPKASRASYILLAKMDDLHGKLQRNLSIAATEAERKRIAEKKYDVKKIQDLLHKVIKKQDVDPTYPMPPGLQHKIDTVLVGENVAALLAPTVPVANRLPANIAAYETAKEARYKTLRNQMNAMNNSDKRELLSKYLASLEDAMEIVKAQIAPGLKESQLAIIQQEVLKIEDLKTKVEKALQDGTPLSPLDKIEIYKIQGSYKVFNIQNGLYRRLEENRRIFNQRNAEAKGYQGNLMVPLANVALPPPPPPPKPLSENERKERRRLALEAAAKRFGSKGGRRTVRRRRGTRKN